MRSARAFSLVVLVFVASLSDAAPAHAWTRTVVQSASATVEVERDATLSILLRLDVEVHAGWLHELELVDLGTDVELDRYRPPYFRSEEGEVFRPEAELHDDGRIRLWFHRRDAPRRGQYRVFMRYRTKADARAVEVDGEPRARIVWSVPAWETGLHDVSVELRAPKGTVVPDETKDPSPGVELQMIERPGRTVARWRRIHVPRMTAWPLTIDAPAASIAVPASDDDEPTPDGFRPLEIPKERHIAWALLLCAVLALLKRRSLELELGRRQLWIHAGWPVVLAVAGGCLAVAQWLAPTQVAWGLPLIGLALHRPVPAAARRSRTWSAGAPARPTAVDIGDWLDATTALGAAVLVACSVALFAAGQPTGALLLLPMFSSGTRHHREPTVDETKSAIWRFAADLRMPPDSPAMCFRWERCNEGWTRLRLHLPTARVGFLSASFVLVSSSLGFLRPRRIMLRVETRAQSDADDLMRRRVKENVELREENGSVVRLVPWDQAAVELLGVMAHKPPKPVKASRGTWLLRKMSEPGRKAA